jgi:hypothetical protein
MMKKLLPALYILVLVLTGCEEIMDIQFEGDSKKTLVVEGQITTDTTAHRVVLSWTGDYFKKPSQDMATGATLTITDGDKTFNLTEIQPGIYQTDPDVYGETGKTYTLHISLPDGREYAGTEKLKYCTEFDSIAQSDNYNHGFAGMELYGYDLLFYGNEPEPVGDQYMFLLYFNDSLCSDTLNKVVFATDEFVNGRYIRDLTTHFIAEAEFIGDSMKVTLEMESITMEYYEYMTGLMLETFWRGTPWDGPPANVPGNMNNGARGYFRASDIKRKTRYFYAMPRRGT